MSLQIRYQIRHDHTSKAGGDVVQLLRTKEEIAASTGWEGTLSSSVNESLTSIDLVHLFNLTRLHETYLFARNAHRQGVPYVVSPIWHAFEDMRPFYLRLGGAPAAAVRASGMVGYLALKEVMYGAASRRLPPAEVVLRWKDRLRWVIEHAAAVLPNSEAEGRALERESGTRPHRVRVVPNATDLPTIPAAGAAREDLVVCAGRIEPRKNQLTVARAFLANPDLEGFKLIFVGAASASHRAYLADLRRQLVPGRVEWWGVRKREEVLGLFSRARIGVLASFFETTGLVGLEAMGCGASVVMTERGYTRDYYGERVAYCDPYDASSVASAMSRALRMEPRVDPGFFDRFSWKAAARATAEAYREVLAAPAEHGVTS